MPKKIAITTSRVTNRENSIRFPVNTGKFLFFHSSVIGGVKVHI